MISQDFLKERGFYIDTDSEWYKSKEREEWINGILAKCNTNCKYFSNAITIDACRLYDPYDPKCVVKNGTCHSNPNCPFKRGV